VVTLSGKEKHIKNNSMGINSQIKSRSITSKASSACKMNMGLVQGASDIGKSKSFVNQGATISAGFSKSGSKAVSTKEEKEEDEEEDEEKEED